MQEGGAQWLECMGQRSPDQFDNGYLLTQEFLREGGEATAIFARNDFLALGAMRALREAGLRVPQDISVIGYNDTILARCADPPLTSVRTPIAQAGSLAVERLIQAIEEKETRFPGVMLPTSITERASCAPPSTS
jgi:LacI family transcriptional regulator